MKRIPHPLISGLLRLALGVTLASVTPSSAQEGQPYFEKGMLRLTATDNDGWADVAAYVSRWNDEKRDWERVTEDRFTQNGKVDYSLAPGLYKLTLRYREADRAEPRTIEGIQITDKTVFARDEYFEKGTLRLTATDNDGWAEVATFVSRWNDEKRDWERVTEDRFTQNGRVDYSLAPGLYKLTLRYREADPEERRTIEGIQITDKTVIAKDEYFEKGALRLTATDNDGWAEVATFVSRWNDEKRDWERVTDDRFTQNGKVDYSLAPGLYKLTLRYREADPEERRTIEAIRIFDRQALALGERFGTGGNLPPLISAAGPFEVGDGDGYYEVGEKVLFRVDLSDSDLASAEFVLNDHVFRTVDKPGRYEEVIALDAPGDRRFAVRARDRSGTVESYGRTIPVSLAKDRPTACARHLPIDYAQQKAVRKCPQCGGEFTAEAGFCSRDGSPLTAPGRAVDGALNTSLALSGLDPRTPEAHHAKQLGLDWLNPFASPRQIQKDTQRIAGDAAGR